MILALFGVFVGVLSWLLAPNVIGLIIADGVGIGLAFYLKALWDKRPIKITCGHCDKVILSNTPWVCGECEAGNTDTDFFPFCFKCKSCTATPKAYKCHHCNKIIFLSEDKDKTKYAYRLHSPKEKPKADEHLEKVEELRKSRTVKAEELSEARVEEELLEIKKRIKEKKQKPRTPKQVLKSGLDQDMEWEEAEVEIMAFIEERYKGDKRLIGRFKRALKKRILSRLTEND